VFLDTEALEIKIKTAFDQFKRLCIQGHYRRYTNVMLIFYLYLYLYSKWWSHCTGTTQDWGKEWLKRWVFRLFPQNSQWRRQRDVLRQSDPECREVVTGKKLVDDGLKVGA